MPLSSRPQPSPRSASLSRDPQSLIGCNLSISLFAKPGGSLDGDAGPRSPQHESPSRWPARPFFHPFPPLKRGQRGARSVEILQRPETDQRGLVFPSPARPGEAERTCLAPPASTHGRSRPFSTIPCPRLSVRGVGGQISTNHLFSIKTSTQIDRLTRVTDIREEEYQFLATFLKPSSNF